MSTRISGMSAVLAAAFVLCLGSNLPASHGHGGGGGGGHMGGGHSGGGGFGGGHHMGGGSFGGSSHHMGGGSFGGGAQHFGGSGHQFSAPQQHHFSAPQQHHFSAPQQHQFSAPQSSGHRIQSFGGSGSHLNQGLGQGTIRHQGSGQGMTHQPMQQPSFSSRHSGSNLTHRGGSATGAGNIGGAGNLSTGNLAGAHRGGSGLSGGHSQHLSGGAINGSNSGSRSNFAARHAATHHAGVGVGMGAGNAGRGSMNKLAGVNHTAHRGGQNGGTFLSQHGTQHHGGAGQGVGTGRTGAGQGNAGLGGAGLANHHAGRPQGLANIPAQRAGAGNVAHHHGQGTGIAHGAIGANQGRHVQHVNAHQMWNGVGRGVGTGLASFHNHHGNVGGVHHGGGNGGYHNHHGYYGGNFRNNRLWFGFGSGFWPYYAWNYRPFWGGYGGYGGWGGGLFGWRRAFRFGYWGGYPSFGFGFGNYGFGGYGLGGFGLGYGLGYGGYGLGYGGYGFGGGYGGYGYNSYCAYNPGYSLYNNGYSYGAYSGSPTYYVDGSAPVTAAYAPGSAAPPSAPVQVAQIDDPTAATTVRAQSADDDLDFGAIGESEFKAGNYDKAVKMWRHAVVDDPKNGVLVMLLAQGLFANGKFDEAAGATQQGMLLLKEDDWGVVIKNYRELYTKIGDYTTQLRVLEKARKDKAEEPGLRFLLGFHYGYLGFPKEAKAELAKAIELAPADELAARLIDVLDPAKAKKASTPVPAETPADPAGIPKKSD